MRNPTPLLRGHRGSGTIRVPRQARYRASLRATVNWPRYLPPPVLSSGWVPSRNGCAAWHRHRTMTVGADLGKLGAVHYPNTHVATLRRPHQKWSACIQHRATDGPHRQSPASPGVDYAGAPSPLTLAGATGSCTTPTASPTTAPSPWLLRARARTTRAAGMWLTLLGGPLGPLPMALTGAEKADEGASGACRRPGGIGRRGQWLCWLP
jgi:hypothetical protein